MLTSSFSRHVSALRRSTPSLLCQCSRTFSIKDFLSKEGKEQRTAKLRKEMQTPYFKDLHAISKDKGKSVVPQLTGLIPSSAAKPFPGVVASNLNDESVHLSTFMNGRVSILLVGFRAYATPMIQQWMKRIHAEGSPFLQQLNAGSLQVLELSVVESALFRSLLRPAILSGMRKNTPSDRYKNVFVLFSKAEELREDVGLTNPLTAYCVLVDGNGFVRWMASGAPSDADASTLAACATQLVREL
jgi:hypothetical protein